MNDIPPPISPNPVRPFYQLRVDLRALGLSHATEDDLPPEIGPARLREKNTLRGPLFPYEIVSEFLTCFRPIGP